MPIGLEFDQEREFRAVGIDVPAVCFHALAQRVEVERPQRAARLHLEEVMRDKEPAIDEEYIGFDAAEAAVQGVQQRALVLVVVMGMGVDQRHRFRSEA